jgi:hydroxymethylpyrimidine/phosphomethylpyrimidine kinase
LKLKLIVNVAVIDAIRLASIYTHQGISQAFPLGKGHGPLNHMHGVTQRSISV